ncbi:uncharacterized protein K460DRAFT_163263 [Cucurbitaria berberidis CBS 394.84]|uniref:BTB domain-containing protein n=1 Tax=Cucurbitaria berberidis CBS 394.84 TaxID=1168544 RepID=A0A9P4L7I9_9PLEO|nr:uncharacterized protein K460DRAFT_163263 [Cucurbitaria berberidis CBS 394.84]KAF1844372.1 hypothetical protein K460DRAFT_163263 [Cucurbitaria berberidis CBS 394.84]
MSDSNSSNKRASNDSEEPTCQKKARTFSDDGAPVESEPVTILAGESEDKFFVHAHLLELSSGFFQKALNKEWKEGQERVVRLPNVDVDVFRIYAKWLYTGRFHCLDGSTDVKLLACDELGNFLHAPDFLDAFVDVILEQTAQLGTPTFLSSSIYPRSVKDSLHRKLCRDLVVYRWGYRNFDTLRSHAIPREFLEDVLLDMKRNFDQGVTRLSFSRFIKDKDACYYHEHTRLNTPCYKTKYGI